MLQARALQKSHIAIFLESKVFICFSDGHYSSSQGIWHKGQRTEAPAYNVGDHIGIILNVDDGAATFFNNGEKVAEISIPKGEMWWPMIALDSGKDRAELTTSHLP